MYSAGRAGAFGGALPGSAAVCIELVELSRLARGIVLGDWIGRTAAWGVMALRAISEVGRIAVGRGLKTMHVASA
jgi:hypothetical protein